MRAVFDYSWSLLPEGQQAVMEALSVFRGGSTRAAAQEATGASLRDLMALVNKSLLHRTPTGRYEVHELLRQYAAEKLDRMPDAGEEVRDRHCAYYVAALQGWGADLQGARQQAALAEMDVEIDNARAAWDWAVERGHVRQLDEAMDGLFRFYEWRGRYQEGESAFQRAAERLSATVRRGSMDRRDRLRVLAKLWTVQSRFSGHTELAGRLLHQGMSLLEGPELADQDTRAEKALLLRQMASKVSFSDNKEYKRLLERSLALYEDLGDRWEMANTLFGLARSAVFDSDFAEMSQRCQESLAIYRSLGDRRGISSALWGLSVAALNLGEADKAEQLGCESLAITEELGARSAVPGRLMMLAMAISLSGKYGEAHSLLGEALTIATDLGSRVNSDLYIPEYQSKTDMERGLYEQARAQAEKALEVARELESWRDIGYTLCVLGSIALAEGAHAEAQRTLEESIAAYRESGKRDELAWALACAGYAARSSGQLAPARRYLCEALRMGVETGGFMALITALPATALLLADAGGTARGEPERAVELYALASRCPYVANSRWFEDVAGREIAVAAASLPPDVVAVAQERGRARDLRATAEELLAELEEQ
jgi:tetratricopeptide (TPR) repeat protein